MAEAVQPISPVSKQYAGLQFSREYAGDIVLEIQGLIRGHWHEVGHYRDEPLDPDYEKYIALEKAGVLRTYTVRRETMLGGYAFYIVSPGIHYRHKIIAVQSTLYLSPLLRKGRTGTDFIAWTEDQLRTDGVDYVTQHVKAKQNPRLARLFMQILERRGYELQDYLLTKKLSK